MSTEQDVLDIWQSRIDVSPFQRWLGLKVSNVDDGSMSVVMPWKDDLISNPNPPTMHGGVLASVIDLLGLYSVLTTGSVSIATIDLRVDYHRPAAPGDIHAEGTVIKMGSKVSTAETKVLDANGKLLASGRGVYLMAN
jgi:uncharacterized protein (TIGR00369 family)